MITSVEKLLENACYKTVLVRVDYNVPMQSGRVTDTTRIEETVNTIRALCKSGAKVGLLSHFGRPEGAGYDARYSLAQITETVENVLKLPVTFLSDCCGITAHNGLHRLENGQVALLENLRFYPGEEKNDLSFAQALASMGHAYVNDAFSCSHRSHASVTGITHFLPSYAGFGLLKEITMLGRALEHPARPVAAVIGGSKVSTKLSLIRNLLRKVDHILIGGGMANTFFKADGADIGASFYEPQMVAEAADLLKNHAEQLVLPVDGYCGLSPDAPGEPRLWDQNTALAGDYAIYDIGPQTVKRFSRYLEAAATILWNGPMGVFEYPPFDRGTAAIASTIAKHKGIRIAGGGDTLSALRRTGHLGHMTFASTAGGAFLEWLEGQVLPGVAALDKDMRRLA